MQKEKCSQTAKSQVWSHQQFCEWMEGGCSNIMMIIHPKNMKVALQMEKQKNEDFLLSGQTIKPEYLVQKEKW